MNGSPSLLEEKRKILVNNLAACNMQARRLEVSLIQIKKFMPFYKDALQRAPEEEVATIDTFILRFGRLQDNIGNKLFRNLLELEQEKFVTMYDILNKIEKIGIVDNINTWSEIREIRNIIIHEYDIDFEKAAKNLNNVVTYAPELLQVITKIEKYVKDKFGI